MITEQVPAAMAGQRVDRVVAFVCSCSRAEATELVAANKVTLDGIPARKGSQKVADGQTITIDEAALAAPAVLEAEPDIELDVVYEDDDLAVVNKQAGLVVHPGGGTRSGTMANALLARYPEIRNVGEPDRPGIVHRLDKGTTGLLMVARTPHALQELQGQLAERSVRRRYECVVLGLPDGDAGRVDAPIGRSPRDATRRAVVVDGRPAVTHFEVKARNSHADLSWVICRLETGRTHQIRVHLSAIGHPVLGDQAYGGRRPIASLGRPALHAIELAFEHPRTGDALSFTAPLPADMAALHAEHFESE